MADRNSYGDGSQGHHPHFPVDDIEIVELDRSGHPLRSWLHTKDNRVLPIHPNGESLGFFSQSLGQWRAMVLDSFLPVGFPYSVSNDYLRYQMFDSLQAFFSTISSLLANRALLQGLGVGDSSSSATFAMLLTILKDAMSRIATIFFAHRFGLRIEPDAKRYRFLADLFNDSAFFLELYSPYLGPWGKMVALSAGEALRALCGVAAGASKAALSVHFAKQNNLAELNAKEASQETAVGLIGLLVGTVIVKRIEDHAIVVPLMILLVLIHLGVNYFGVRSVCMNTLNRQRATILFQEYLQHSRVLSPEEVAEREDIIFWNPHVRHRTGELVAHIEFADNYGQAMGYNAPHNKKTLKIDSDMHTRFICPPAYDGQLTHIKILLWKDTQPKDAICAWFGAMETAWISCFSPSRRGLKPIAISQVTRCFERRLWEAMVAKGWDLRTHGLETKAPVRLKIQSRVKED